MNDHDDLNGLTPIGFAITINKYDHMKYFLEVGGVGQLNVQGATGQVSYCVGISLTSCKQKRGHFSRFMATVAKSLCNSSLTTAPKHLLRMVILKFCHNTKCLI